MHRKNAQDAKRAQRFTKIIREVRVATRLGGPDSALNARLRTALVNARGANLSKDTIDKAIKKASGEGQGADYKEIMYEGYGPGGSAFLVEALTNNRNRTASELRFVFQKQGGVLGEKNSVGYLFEQVGIIAYMAPHLSFEEIFGIATKVDVQDVVQQESGGFYLVTHVKNFIQIRDHFMNVFPHPLFSCLQWRCASPLALKADEEEKAEMLYNALQKQEDVSDVWSNASFLQSKNND